MALGLLPVLISRCLGPTRTRRSVWLQFVKWIRIGRPRGFNPVDERHLMKEEESERSSGLAQHDWRSPGEIAAEELGFPFTLTVRNLDEHFPFSLFVRHSPDMQSEQSP